jgi:alpha-L-fucosidase
MDRIGGMARKNQPGIIVVDRTVPGKWENYVTPEQAIPDHPLDIPWESCITMGNSFSYVPNDQYKPTKKIVETLVKIISRGGNYLMNIAPGPNGDFDQAAYDRLKELAKWIKINESAIYATRSVAPYHENEYYYTRSKDNKTINVFHLTEGESYTAPNNFTFQLPENSKVNNVKVLGHTGKIKWNQKDNTVTVQNPTKNLEYATVIQLNLK